VHPEPAAAGLDVVPFRLPFLQALVDLVGDEFKEADRKNLRTVRLLVSIIVVFRVLYQLLAPLATSPCQALSAAVTG
jgi:hypothetical protein